MAAGAGPTPRAMRRWTLRAGCQSAAASCILQASSNLAISFPTTFHTDVTVVYPVHAISVPGGPSETYESCWVSRFRCGLFTGLRRAVIELRSSVEMRSTSKTHSKDWRGIAAYARSPARTRPTQRPSVYRQPILHTAFMPMWVHCLEVRQCAPARTSGGQSFRSVRLT